MHKRFYFLLLFCCYSLLLVGQTDSYQHEIIGTRDGLQSPKIYALHQDRDRRLWIGTELGFSIYNGYEFRNVQYSINNALVGRVLTIVSDPFGGTWIGGDNGLFYAYGDRVRKITIKGRTTFAVEALLADQEGNLWLGEFNGLLQMKAPVVKSLAGTDVSEAAAAYYGEFRERVFSIYADPKLNLYIARFDGVFLMRKNSHTLETIWKNPHPQNYVRSVIAFSPDSVYWNCYDAHPMKKINGIVSASPHAGYVGRTVFIHNNKPYALTTSGIASIETSSTTPVLSFENLTNHVPASLVDAEGNFWLGSWEGLIKYRKTGFNQYALTHSLNTDAFSLLETSKGELLIGGNRGRVFIKKTDSIIPHPDFPLMFAKAELMTMYEHSDGSFWFGSGYQGITQFKNSRLRHWNGLSDELQNNNCEAIFNAGNGKLFACTEKGVTIIDPTADNPIQGYYNYKRNYTVYPELFGGIQVGDNWIFYGSKGMFRLQNNLLEDDSIGGLPTASVYINKIAKDKAGFYWVATLGHGLLKCKAINSRLVLFKQFNQKNGLPTDDILSVLVDKNNDVWSADYMSLTVVKNNNNGDQVVSFNERDGLLRSYYQTLKLEQQKNGNIWGLTTMGLVQFHPDSLTSNMLPPVLKLDAFIINENDSATRRLIADAEIKTGISFSYQENSARFSFTANSLTDPSKIHYAYRLKGLDSNWTISSSRFVNFNFLPPGKYVFELKASNNNNVWTPTPITIPFSIRPPFWKTWWFIGLCFLLLVSVFYAIFRSRVKRLKEKSAIRQQLAELEGKALRAQMNPHFIFNSLNAIQELIVMEKIDAAYEYLARFSRLLRMVLNNSEKNLVSLQEEIDMISIYLELESLRFKNSFSYSIEVDNDIDPDEAEIPPLLLQPFIENAIWHGLRNKEGEKNLSIRCSSNDRGLLCTIADNGIGREKARAIKAGKMGAAGFESRGMLLSEQRMQMMNLGHDNKFNLEVEDLHDESGQASGTNVILHLPQRMN